MLTAMRATSESLSGDPAALPRWKSSSATRACTPWATASPTGCGSAAPGRSRGQLPNSHFPHPDRGADIHPGAVIGARTIDHATGVVIGERRAGDDVVRFITASLSAAVAWLAGKRHPTVGDRVIIGQPWSLGPIKARTAGSAPPLVVAKPRPAERGGGGRGAPAQ